MKTRKIIETYTVLSLGQIRQIARLAEASALAMYGHGEASHCVVLRGMSIKPAKKLQFSVETVCGAGKETRLTWQE